MKDPMQKLPKMEYSYVSVDMKELNDNVPDGFIGVQTI